MELALILMFVMAFERLNALERVLGLLLTDLLLLPSLTGTLLGFRSSAITAAFVCLV